MGLLGHSEGGTHLASPTCPLLKRWHVLALEVRGSQNEGGLAVPLVLPDSHHPGSALLLEASIPPDPPTPLGVRDRCCLW